MKHTPKHHRLATGSNMYYELISDYAYISCKTEFQNRDIENPKKACTLSQITKQLRILTLEAD